jgi:hypothetical protein
MDAARNSFALLPVIFAVKYLQKRQPLVSIVHDQVGFAHQ